MDSLQIAMDNLIIPNWSEECWHFHGGLISSRPLKKWPKWYLDPCGIRQVAENVFESLCRYEVCAIPQKWLVSFENCHLLLYSLIFSCTCKFFNFDGHTLKQSTVFSWWKSLVLLIKPLEFPFLWQIVPNSCFSLCLTLKRWSVTCLIVHVLMVESTWGFPKMEVPLNYHKLSILDWDFP